MARRSDGDGNGRTGGIRTDARSQGHRVDRQTGRNGPRETWMLRQGASAARAFALRRTPDARKEERRDGTGASLRDALLPSERGRDTPNERAGRERKITRLVPELPASTAVVAYIRAWCAAGELRTPAA